uniref:Uncharacterized protein n=1 Tax=Oryza punctata TaxID=4537 RepID=A0A0E0LU55_ORYPU
MRSTVPVEVARGSTRGIGGGGSGRRSVGGGDSRQQGGVDVDAAKGGGGEFDGADGADTGQHARGHCVGDSERWRRGWLLGEFEAGELTVAAWGSTAQGMWRNAPARLLKSPGRYSGLLSLLAVATL